MDQICLFFVYNVFPSCQHRHSYHLYCVGVDADAAPKAANDDVVDCDIMPMNMICHPLLILY